MDDLLDVSVTALFAFQFYAKQNRLHKNQFGPISKPDSTSRKRVSSLAIVFLPPLSAACSASSRRTCRSWMIENNLPIPRLNHAAHLNRLFQSISDAFYMRAVLLLLTQLLRQPSRIRHGLLCVLLRRFQLAQTRVEFQLDCTKISCFVKIPRFISSQLTCMAAHSASTLRLFANSPAFCCCN